MLMHVEEMLLYLSSFLMMFGPTLCHSPLLYFHISLLFCDVAFGIRQK